MRASIREEKSASRPAEPEKHRRADSLCYACFSRVKLDGTAFTNR